MKQTNYHLFDFMDFDPSLQKDEALWKAYAPSRIEERDGDIVVTIPYQKQLHQEDMAPDNGASQQSYELIIRAYEPNIVRVFTTMVGDAMTEYDDMLQFSADIKRQALRYADGDVIAANGKKIATIDPSTPHLDHWSDLLPLRSQHLLSRSIQTATSAKVSCSVTTTFLPHAMTPYHSVS